MILEDAKKRLAKDEKDAKDAPGLRERIATLKDTNDDQKRQLDKLAPWLDSEDGKKAVEIQSDLTRTRYVAYAGWGCSALLGLALAAAYLFYKPLPEPESTPEDIDRPPHQIV